MNRRRLLLTTCTILLVIAALLAPLSASAGRWDRAQGMIFVPRHATVPYRLEVSGVSVTIMPGSMPRGGIVFLRVTSAPNGQFVAEFLPERTFERPVMMDFRSSPAIVYESPHGDVVYRTADLDGNGEPGEIWSMHFSRYSGW